jgi:hypothetical protein
MRADAPAVERWGRDFEGLLARAGTCFGRHDLRSRAGGYVRGLLGRVDRKNGWQVAEYLGDAKPRGVQRALGRARRDAGRLRDEVLCGVVKLRRLCPQAFRPLRGGPTSRTMRFPVASSISCPDERDLDW